MNNTDRVIQAVEAGSFDRIALQVSNVENEVVIKRGERESLTIEARPDVFARLKTEIRDGQMNVQMGGSWSDKLGAALATSLTRPHVRYVFTVRRLTGLDVAGLAGVRVEDVEVDRLRVKFSGLGSLSIDGLIAERLEVEASTPGPCRIEANGHVEAQRVSLSGMGDYDARGLESHVATVTLKGPGGHAVVWAKDELEITISGPGTVEYFGNPVVTKKVAPLGVVRRLVAREAAAAQR